MFSDIMKEMLRTIASALQIPVIIILILLLIFSVFALGGLLVEWYTEHRRMKEWIPALLDKVHGAKMQDLPGVIDQSGLLRRQKGALLALVSKGEFPEHTREALARQLLFEEQRNYDKTVKWTDIIARTAPMFGLLGTLIPLGPGLVALGRGDTKTLSDSLLIAFDTTIAGLMSGAVAYVVSTIRRRWYESYMVGLETMMETILDRQNGYDLLSEEEKADLVPEVTP